MITTFLRSIPQPFILRMAAFVTLLLMPLIAAASIIVGTLSFIKDYILEIGEFFICDLPAAVVDLVRIIKTGKVR